MKKGFALISTMLLVAGCADHYLDISENEIVGRADYGAWSDIDELALYSRKLSIAYREAAKNTSTIQDVQSLVVFVAAGAFVSGIIKDISKTALANRALAGASAQQIGSRTAPKSAIIGMYIGAKRLNCISTVAYIGDVSFKGNTKIAAQALTYGAIEEVRITTRESLVRNIADYNQLVTDITPSELLNTASLTAEGPPDQRQLDAFSAKLAKCLSKEADKPEDS